MDLELRVCGLGAGFKEHSAKDSQVSEGVGLPWVLEFRVQGSGTSSRTCEGKNSTKTRVSQGSGRP